MHATTASSKLDVRLVQELFTCEMVETHGESCWACFAGPLVSRPPNPCGRACARTPQHCEQLRRTNVAALTAMMITLLIMLHAAVDAAAPPLLHEPELSHIPTQTQSRTRLRVQTLCQPPSTRSTFFTTKSKRKLVKGCAPCSIFT